MATVMERRRLVAEVRTPSAVQALGVVDALASAGITVIEVSMATRSEGRVIARGAYVLPGTSPTRPGKRRLGRA